MRSTERTPTLARRLAWTLALSSTLAAVLALVIALPLADALIRGQIEREVSGAAAVLAAELAEKPSLSGELDEEAKELGIDGRVTIEDLDAGTPTGCGRVESGTFACHRQLAHDPARAVVVAIPVARLTEHRASLWIAGFGVLIVALLSAALVGRSLAARVLAPLASLQRAVIDIDASAPTAIELPPKTGFAELDALRSALANLLERLDTELTLTRRFTSAAAHELRTPLTKMLAELELAAEGGASASPAALERLHQTTAHLVTLTERLLSLATPSDALDSDRATSIAALAEALGDRRSPTEVARLEIVTDEGDGLVRGDEILLAAMLDNVVDNALNFSTGSVRVSVQERAGEVLIAVEDTGPGVPDELSSELFLPFRRASQNQARPGHGLGLALVAHVAQACGGSARFVPDRPSGARVEICLPRIDTSTTTASR
jgi:signal transduction histidine kinase